MRKALIVGIDYYERAPKLYGCVHDAENVNNILARHADGALNFGANLLVATDPSNMISRSELRSKVNELFDDEAEVALFYFAGHGHLDATDGYLLTSECEYGHDGLSMNDLLSAVNKSKARSRIIIIDSCHSGQLGTPDIQDDKAILKDGVTILTASTAKQYSVEEGGSGVFTALFVDALRGGAANLLGDITPGSVYAHIDQSLGPWEQRPVFKTNVKNFTILRKAEPSLSLVDLRKITELFHRPDEEIHLNPGYEPDSSAPDSELVRKFALLQRYNRVNLVIPIGEEHMYYAAMNSKSCELTALGVHYWNLVASGRI